MIKYRIGNTTYTTESINFPAGEVGSKLISENPTWEGFPQVEEITVIAHLPNNDEIMRLLFTVDALRREYGDVKLKAIIPYIPYARQDRQFKGEALSAAVMAGLINNLGFSEVITLDPHSDVMSALIKNIRIVNQTDVFKRLHKPAVWANIHIVAPDAGAYKKSAAFAKAVGAKGVIVCNKERVDGHVVGLTMSDDVTGLNLFVLDDICDGGRTFTELAKLTTQANQVELAVTHGLFTKGVDVVANCFHSVYTTDSFTGNPTTYDVKSATNFYVTRWFSN